jgi:hypothetical protein
MSLKLNSVMVHVEVESSFVDSRSGIGKNGKPYAMHTQKAWMYLGSKFPKEVQLDVPSVAEAWPVGMYQTDLLPALDVGDFGRVEIDMRKLRLMSSPLADAVKPASRAA